MAAAIEIAWAGSSAHADDAHEQLEDRGREQERDDADREEARRLEAGAAALRAWKVQCRFHQKLFSTATTNASVAADQVVDAEHA